MDEETYIAIKNKFHNEILDIEKEISILLLKKDEIIKNKDKEIEKIKKTTSMLTESSTVVAASLQTRINYGIFKKTEKEINIINGYLEDQNVLHEKMKEKVKVLNEMFEAEVKEMNQKKSKTEENELIEYSNFVNKRLEV